MCQGVPRGHVQVVAAAEARRDESSPHASWKELLQHLEQAYEFDRVVYLSNYLTPHTDTVGDIELLRSVFRTCAGRRVQLLYVAGPAGAEGAADAAGRTGKGIIAHAANDLCRCYAAREGVQTKILRVPFLYTASAALEDPFLVPMFDACSTGSAALQGAQDAAFPLLCAEELSVLVRRIFDSWDGNFETLDVADTFHHTAGEVGEALQALFPGLSVAYGDSAGYALPGQRRRSRALWLVSALRLAARPLDHSGSLGCWPCKEGQPLARGHRPHSNAHAACQMPGDGSRLGAL